MVEPWIYTRIFDCAEGQCPNSWVAQGSTVIHWARRQWCAFARQPNHWCHILLWHCSSPYYGYSCLFSFFSFSPYLSPFPSLTSYSFFSSNFFLSTPHSVPTRGAMSISWSLIYTPTRLCLEQIQISWGSTQVTHEIIHTALQLCFPYAGQMRVYKNLRRIWVFFQHESTCPFLQS